MVVLDECITLFSTMFFFLPLYCIIALALKNIWLSSSLYMILLKDDMVSICTNNVLHVSFIRTLLDLYFIIQERVYVALCLLHCVVAYFVTNALLYSSTYCFRYGSDGKRC